MLDLKTLLKQIASLRQREGKHVTLLAACPNSAAVLEAAVPEQDHANETIVGELVLDAESIDPATVAQPCRNLGGGASLAGACGAAACPGAPAAGWTC